MKIGKISLWKFFHKYNMLEIKNTMYKYIKKEETIKYIFIKCIHFKKIVKKIIWVYKVKKAKFNEINLQIILTTFNYIKKITLFIQKKTFLINFEI